MSVWVVFVCGCGCVLSIYYFSTCTSVMINHCGANLSEQHNDLLCTKQDLLHTSRYVDESSSDSQVLHKYANSQDSYSQCDYICIN